MKLEFEDNSTDQVKTFGFRKGEYCTTTPNSIVYSGCVSQRTDNKFEGNFSLHFMNIEIKADSIEEAKIKFQAKVDDKLADFLNLSVRELIELIREK